MARTVLVAEDEEPLRTELAYQLEQDGYRVVQASDGAKALERFRAEAPDLVLLVLMLPALSGIGFTGIGGGGPRPSGGGRGGRAGGKGWGPGRWARGLPSQSRPARWGGADSRLTMRV